MNKDEKIVKVLKRVLPIMSILTAFLFIMLINKKSYALFTKHIETDTTIHIETADKISFTNVVKSTMRKEGGITGLDPSTGEVCSSRECKEYRYSGSNVNNYVYFNCQDDVTEEDANSKCELWRILGIFKDAETNESYIRVVRNEVLPADYFPKTYVKDNVNYKLQYSPDSTDIYWNNGGSNNNDWSVAGLQYWLNAGETSNEKSPDKGYLSYLSETTKSMLADRIHYLGAVDNYSDTPLLAYQHERDINNCLNNKGEVSKSEDFPKAGCNAWDGNFTTWTGKVSLMYASDYGYSVNSKNWKSAKFRSDDNGSQGTFADAEVNETSWIYTTINDSKNKFIWFITPQSRNSSSTIGLHAAGTFSNGTVNLDHSYYERSVMPVLNLKSEVKITSGDGTLEKPYFLSGN